jgi:hypothetical protein
MQLDNFDWNNSESIVVEPVNGMAVYRNPTGHVVIREQEQGDNDVESFVLIRPDSVRDVIAALEQLAASIESENVSH